MRTKGEIEYRHREFFFVGKSPAEMVVWYTRDDDGLHDDRNGDHLRHIAACWNAIERIGGEPELVDELVSVVRECGRFCTFERLQRLLAKLPEDKPGTPEEKS